MAKKRIEDKLPPENAQISLASYWPTRPFIPHEKNTKLFTTQGVKSCLVDDYGNPQGTVDLLETHEKKKTRNCPATLSTSFLFFLLKSQF
jgi:hypothetical protein